MALTPGKAWEGYVGSQTPAEFMELSRERGHTSIEAAVDAYLQESAFMFTHLSREERNEARRLLIEYIRSSL